MLNKDLKLNNPTRTNDHKWPTSYGIKKVFASSGKIKS